MNLKIQSKNVKIGILNLLKSDIGRFYIVRAFGLVITLIINLLLLKNLSPSLYGNWTIATLLIALGVLVVSFGTRKLAYSYEVIDDNLLNRLVSQIILTSLLLSIILYCFIHNSISLGLFITTSFIVFFTSLYQLVQVRVEKSSLTKFGVIDIFIAIFMKSGLIYLLSFYSSLEIYIFLIPILLTAVLRLLFFWKLSKVDFKFQYNVKPGKTQLKLLATNISDWTFANAFRISLVSSLPLLELGLLDRAFAFLKVPTNLVQETAQRVMYNKIGTKNSIKYILINAIFIIGGCFSVIYFGLILGFWEGEWTEMTKYMLLVVPYVMVETIANLFIPYIEMTKELLNTKTTFNFSFTSIVFLCIYLNVQFSLLLTIVTSLEAFRLIIYLHLLRKNN